MTSWNMFHCIKRVALFLKIVTSFVLLRTRIYVIKRKLHVGLNIWSLFFLGKKKEIFFPLKDKLRMFAPPCNILYIFTVHRVISSIYDVNVSSVWQMPSQILTFAWQQEWKHLLLGGALMRHSGVPKLTAMLVLMPFSCIARNQIPQILKLLWKHGKIK